MAELGTTAAYLSQAEMVLSSDHMAGATGADYPRGHPGKLVQDETVARAAEYREQLAALKKGYITAYVAQHSKVRLGVAEDKTKSGLRKDSRLVAMRALAYFGCPPASSQPSMTSSTNSEAALHWWNRAGRQSGSPALRVTSRK